MPYVRMKSWLLAWLLGATSWIAAQTPRWQISLPQNPGLESFDREASAIWMSQQGVLFLMPDKILLYQVNRTRDFAKLGPRRAGGGAGNFLLNIKVLSARDGRLLKSMDVLTSGGQSQVLATRGGGFVVQAGSALYSYSSDFAKVAERELPLDKSAEPEDWQARVSPSGEKLVLMHQQIFMAPELLADQTVLHDGKAKVDVQVLNAATLQTEKSFALDHTLAFWAPMDDRFISSNPAHSYSDGQMGTLDFSGNWSPLKTEVPKENTACRLGMIAINQQRVALYGCDAVSVFSTSGERLFRHQDLRMVFVSALAAGAHLAAQCNHYRMEAFGVSGGILAGTRADRVEVYDLDSQKRRMSVPIRGSSAYYALSAEGDLAVVDGPNLRVFHVDK
ncbi:MAG TPA: hypothetical protein VKL40_03205 [Candidatus Angelobacter sp.]|nr:hypothetical protein [Candidatus Angelobacter sp.]